MSSKIPKRKRLTRAEKRILRNSIPEPKRERWLMVCAKNSTSCKIKVFTTLCKKPTSATTLSHHDNICIVPYNLYTYYQKNGYPDCKDFTENYLTESCDGSGIEALYYRIMKGETFEHPLEMKQMMLILSFISSQRYNHYISSGTFDHLIKYTIGYLQLPDTSSLCRDLTEWALELQFYMLRNCFETGGLYRYVTTVKEIIAFCKKYKGMKGVIEKVIKDLSKFVKDPYECYKVTIYTWEKFKVRQKPVKRAEEIEAIQSLIRLYILWNISHGDTESIHLMGERMTDMALDPEIRDYVDSRFFSEIREYSKSEVPRYLKNGRMYR